MGKHDEATRIDAAREQGLQEGREEGLQEGACSPESSASCSPCSSSCRSAPRRGHHRPGSPRLLDPPPDRAPPRGDVPGPRRRVRSAGTSHQPRHLHKPTGARASRHARPSIRTTSRARPAHRAGRRGQPWRRIASTRLSSPTSGGWWGPWGRPRPKAAAPCLRCHVVATAGNRTSRTPLGRPQPPHWFPSRPGNCHHFHRAPPRPARCRRWKRASAALGTPSRCRERAMELDDGV